MQTSERRINRLISLLHKVIIDVVNLYCPLYSPLITNTYEVEGLWYTFSTDTEPETINRD